MSFINPDVVSKDVLGDLVSLSFISPTIEGWSKKSEIKRDEWDSRVTASFFEKDGDIVVAVYSQFDDGMTLAQGINFYDFAEQIRTQLDAITTDNSKVYFTGFGSAGDIVNLLSSTQSFAELKSASYIAFASTLVLNRDSNIYTDQNPNLLNIGFHNDPLFNLFPELEPNKYNVPSLFYTNNAYWGADTLIEYVRSAIELVDFALIPIDIIYGRATVLFDVLDVISKEGSIDNDQIITQTFQFGIDQATGNLNDLYEGKTDLDGLLETITKDELKDGLISLATLIIDKSLDFLQEKIADNPHDLEIMSQSIGYLVKSTFYDYIVPGNDITFVNSDRNQPFSIKDLFVNDETIKYNPDQVLLGTDDDNWIDGFEFSPNLIEGFGGNDELVGGRGNDRLKGGEGNDELDGGIGPADLAIYDGVFWDYLLNNNNEDWEVTENNINFNFNLAHGVYGYDTLENIEYVEFDNEDDKWVYAVDDLLNIELIESSHSITGGDLSLRYQNTILTDEHAFEFSFTPSLPQKIYIAYDFGLNGGFTTDVGWNDTYTDYDTTKTSSYANAIDEIKSFIKYLTEVEADSTHTTLALNGDLFGYGQNYDLVDAISYLDNPNSSSFNNLKGVGYKTPSENTFSSLNYSGPAEAAVRWFTNDYEITPEKNQNKFFYITEGFGLPLENLDTDIYSVNVYKEAEAINEPDPYFHLKNAGAPEVSFEVEGGHPAWVNSEKDWFARLSDVSEAHAIGMSGESIPLGDLQSVGLYDGVLEDNLNLDFSLNDITIRVDQMDLETGKLVLIDEEVLEDPTKITLTTDPTSSSGENVITVAVADDEFSFKVPTAQNHEDYFYRSEEENTDANNGSTDDEILIVDDGLIDDEIIIVDDGLIDVEPSTASASGQTFSHFKDHVIQILSSNNVASNTPILDEFII